MKATMTPWGAAVSVIPFGSEGVQFMQTASHGGFYVPSNLLERVHAAGRLDARRWSGSENWFEEDCCWAHVAIAFPELFDPDWIARAKAMNANRMIG